MEYDEERVSTVIDQAVEEGDADPAFYAISGSHLYGFPSEEGGDVDVRGFHVADGTRYALLDPPAEQYVVNQDGVTDGYEAYAEVDLVSYELRKFGTLLYEANYNVLEVVFEGPVALDDVPRAMDSLRSLVESHLPLDVPQSYLGMARTNYQRYIGEDPRRHEPTAKKYLYVIRGLLGATYVAESESIEADVRTLSEAVLGDAALVSELVDAKREHENATLDDDLRRRADRLVEDLFETTDLPEPAGKEEYREKLNDWMRDIRAA